MERIKDSLIIHSFALFHIITAITCLYLDLNGTMPLTILTMVMTIIICFRNNADGAYTAADIIIVNTLGYLMGTMGIDVLWKISSNEYLINSLSTFITTEILGWSSHIFMEYLNRSNKNNNENRNARKKYNIVIAIVLLIILLRFVVVLPVSQEILQNINITDIIVLIASNPTGIICSICLIIIYVRFWRRRNKKNFFTYVELFLFIVCIAFVTTCLAFASIPECDMKSVATKDFIQTLLISVIMECTIYCVTFLTDTLLITRQNMFEKSIQASDAKLKYMQLKQQVNPHFLFNSLNILTGLIRKDEKNLAIDYTNKLAVMYRYLINCEDKTTVRLNDEIEFVNKYIDLLKIRFPSGLEFSIDIKKDKLKGELPPCALQILIENAIKHNMINSNNPLIIEIYNDEDYITVKNNLILKRQHETGHRSGIGHEYIIEHYKYLTDREIVFSINSEYYSVSLPLV